MTSQGTQTRVPIFTLEAVSPVYRTGQVAKYNTTITVGRAAELLENDQIMVDYDYQRGIKVTYDKNGTKKHTPMVDWGRVNEMTDKMLNNQLHGGSLTWNLRGQEVDYQYDMALRCLHIFSGQPTIPDSNHRHQAIARLAELVKTRGYGFDVNSYEFPLVIEVLDLDGEKGLFYEYNQLGKPANPTRSRYINQADLPNAVASQMIEDSILRGHVELVTNNISRNSTKVATFNTLARGIQDGFPDLDDDNRDEVKDFLVNFFNKLAAIRPETGFLEISARKQIRTNSIADTALVYQAYVKLAGDIFRLPNWTQLLAKLAEPYRHVNDGQIEYEGDLMSRRNPLWFDTVLIRAKNGTMSVSNRTESRRYVHTVLRDLMEIPQP